MPRPSSPWGVSAVVLLALSFTAAPSYAADRSAPTTQDIDGRVSGLGQRVEEVRRNFTDRSGLIGVGEATARYKDAVYQFLLGDYANAATSFYILVQSNALGNADLSRDAEWYLAESLFELDDYATADEAYRRIVQRGEGHPYFPDAVRRSLEVYALTGADEKFDAYYRAFIESGRVPTTDLVTYTLGKAFYRRHEDAQADTALAAVKPESLYYARALYFRGALKTRSQDYAGALVQFKAAAAVPAEGTDAVVVASQAQLAVARLAYETGDYPTAGTFYAKIDDKSTFYADALRELVWTCINQKDWAGAAKDADAFLNAFPQHRYTADMQILRGHLGMKERDYDSALAAYQKVVDGYSPVAETLDSAGRDPATLRKLLAQIADGKSGVPTDAIPAYAEEMLLADDRVARASHLWVETHRQADEIALCERMLRELDIAIGGSGDQLTNFVAARSELGQVWAASLSTRSQILDAEGAWLRGRVSSTLRGRVTEILKERTVVAPASATPPTGDRETAIRHSVAARYGDLRNSLRALRGGITDSASQEAFTRFDREWAALDNVDAANDRAGALLRESEARELQAVKDRLEAQRQRLATLRAQVDAAGNATETLAERVMSVGVDGLADGFRQSVLEADKGSVDVFWLQKTETSDAMTGLAVDQNKALDELRQKYASLRENLK